MTAMRLYEAVEALDLVTAWLIESEGEITPEIDALLESAGHDFADKVEQVAAKITELRAVEKAQKEEADRLSARATRTGNAAESLMRYLKLNLERVGTKKVEGLRFTVSIANNAPALTGTLDETTVLALAQEKPEWVRTVPAKVELDRRAILTAAKAGAALPDGLVVVHNTSLRIR